MNIKTILSIMFLLSTTGCIGFMNGYIADGQSPEFRSIQAGYFPAIASDTFLLKRIYDDENTNLAKDIFATALIGIDYPISFCVDLPFLPLRCLIYAVHGKTEIPTPAILREIPDPHQHYGQVHLAKTAENIMNGVKFERVTKMPTETDLYTKNLTGTKVAYVSSDQVSYVTYKPDLFFLTDLRYNRTYRLLNVHFPHRPVSDIDWLTENLVCFDIWTGPHYGVHYVIDANNYIVLHAAHFHDEFIEKTKNSEP